MKSQLIAIVAAVLVVGCGESTHQESDLSPLSISPLLDAASEGNIEAAKQAIADGEDVNVKAGGGMNSLHYAAIDGPKEIAELLTAKSTDKKKKKKTKSADEKKRNEFLSVFNKNYQKTVINENLFFVLDSTLDPGNISEDQIIFLESELKKIKNIKNIFVITHHVIWQNYTKKKIIKI